MNLETSRQQAIERFLKTHPDVLHWRLTVKATDEWQQLWWAEHGAIRLDQSRESTESETRLWCSVRLEHGTVPPEYQGEAEFTLHPDRPWQPQVEDGIRTARATKVKYWKPFPQGATLGAPPTVAQMAASPAILENPSSELQKLEMQLAHSVRESLSNPQRPAGLPHVDELQFHSAETALVRETRFRRWSEGVESTDFQTSAYAEVALSATTRKDGARPRSDEYLHVSHGVSVDDLNLSRLVEEATGAAQEIVFVQPTRGGDLPVIFGTEAIAEIIAQSSSQLRSSSAYLQLPVRPIGQEWIPGGATLFSLSLRPDRAGRVGSNWLSGQGVLEKPIHLVASNQVRAHMTDAQHGAYLDTAPTTLSMNWELDIQGRESLPRDRAALIQSAIQRFGGVLEIVQLSGLFVDAVATTFSSEIRLARWWDASGNVERWKGGSVSGSLLEHFKDAIGCQAIGDYQRSGGFMGDAVSYRGPEAICLVRLPVTGATHV